MQCILIKHLQYIYCKRQLNDTPYIFILISSGFIVYLTNYYRVTPPYPISQRIKINFNLKSMSNWKNKTKAQLIAEIESLQKTISVLQRRSMDAADMKDQDASGEYQHLKDHHKDAQRIANIGSWTYDIKRGLYSVSDEIFTILNTTREETEATFENFFSLVHPDDRDLLKDAYSESLQNQTKLDVSHRLLLKDGTIKYVHERCETYFEEDGTPMVSIGVIQDITEQWKAQEAIKKSEDRLAFMAKNSSNMIYRMSLPDGNYEYISDACEKLFGYPAEEFYRSPILIREITHPDWHNYFEEKWKELIQGNMPPTYEYQIIHKSGATRWMYQRNILVKNKSGDPVAIEGIVTDITNHKITLNALLESEKRFRQVAESAEEWIWEVDKNGLYTYVSPVIEEILGYTPDEVIGKKHFYDFFDPEVKIELKEAAFQAFSKKLSFKNFENPNQHKDGSKVILETSGVPILDHNGELLGYRGADHDITERKNAEEAIMIKNQAIETSVSGIGITDMDGRLIYVNEAVVKMWGYQSKEEVLGRPLPEFWQGDRIFKTIENLTKHGKDSGEDIGLRKDGSLFNVLFTANVLKDVKGQPIHLVGSFMDITDLKKASTALEDSEMKFRTFAEHSPSMIFVNQGGKVVYANKACHEITGYSVEELTAPDFDFMCLVADESKELIAENLKKHMQGIEIPPYEYSIVTKRGDRINTIITTRIIQYENKPAVLGIITDITGRKKTEVELRRAKEKAEESDHLKSAFLANMSHEIRTPMNAIMGFAEILDDEPDIAKEERQKFIRIIYQRSNDLLKIINDILDISKIEAKQMNLNPYKGDLSALFSEIHEFFQSTKIVTQNNIDFRVVNSVTGDKGIIKTDFDRLSQIIINLVNNALKFTKEGFVEVGNLVESKDTLLFYVKDTGIGIPAEKLEMVFEPFRQVNETLNKEKVGGTGLGLSICKGLVSLLNGKIWVESEMGKGSVFYFTIPYIRADEEDTKMEEKPNIINAWPGKKILMVEDDPNNLIHLEKLLSDCEADLLVAVNGKEAKEIIRANPDTNIVLMDIRLPDINGFDLTIYIKSTFPDIPVIAQTAFASKEDQKKCMDAGCDGFISKPLKRGLLFDLISKFIR